MGIINRDNRFVDLIKAIKSSKLSVEDKKLLLSYIDEVKSGKRNNDFFEDEFLERVFLEIIHEDEKEEEYNFEQIIKNVKFVFPYGKETEDYSLLKNMFIINLENHNILFDSKMFSLFDDKRDYLDIMNIILSNADYKAHAEEIIEYGLSVAPYCQNQSILKQEIVAFIYKTVRCDDIEKLHDECLMEAKKRVGVYPVDEKTLALIASEARKAQSLIQKLENLQARVNNHQKEVDAATKKGLDELQHFIDTQKDLLIKKLDEYLLEIEKDLKISSDKVFKQVLMDAQRKINEVKLMAASLSSRTTDELLRIQQMSEESVARLKEYVENDPKVRELVEEAGGEAKLKDLLSSLHLTGSPVSSSTTTSGIYIPGNDRLVVPMNGQVIIPENIDSKVLPVFDESIPFDERMKFVLKKMQERKDNGEIFHEMTEEILRCVIEGDWVYLWGPSGCGKSYVIKQVARLLGLDLVQNGKITDKYSVMAYNDPHGRFRATQAFVALVYGKMLSLDEFDNGNTDTQVVLNELYSGLLDVLEKPEEKRFITFAEDMSVPINPNFRMISAGNTSGDGENNLFSSRGKIDEAVQERMTPKKFYYDNRVERIIFENLDAWYTLFTNFRKICDAYAKKAGVDSAPGIVTTRDASAIAKYVRHNSKTLDQVLREKFVQVKDDNYLNFIIKSLKEMYEIEDSEDVVDLPLTDYSAKQLGKKLIYTCREAIKTGRR